MPKLARVSVSSATITVPAEAVMDSPTRAIPRATASFGSRPSSSSSRTRNTRNRP